MATSARRDPTQGADTGALASASTAPTSAWPGAREAELPPVPRSEDEMRVDAEIQGNDDMAADARAAGDDPMAIEVQPTPRLDETPTAPGPRDAQITREVRVALDSDEDLSPSTCNVVITTHQGVVTLSGNVATASERARVDAHARSVSGVSRVENQLRVMP